MNRITNRKRQFTFQALLNGTFCFAFSTMTMALENSTTSSSTLDTHHVHGEGKKSVSCDMTKIQTNYKGIKTNINVKDLIKQSASGLVHESAHRIIKKGSPVLPVYQLIERYPQATSLAFKACDSVDTISLSRKEINKNKYMYIITLSQTGRARLTELQLKGTRGFYNTIVKNLYAIEFIQ